MSVLSSIQLTQIANIVKTVPIRSCDALSVKHRAQPLRVRAVNAGLMMCLSSVSHSKTKAVIKFYGSSWELKSYKDSNN